MKGVVEAQAERRRLLSVKREIFAKLWERMRRQKSSPDGRHPEVRRAVCMSGISDADPDYAAADYE